MRPPQPAAQVEPQFLPADELGIGPVMIDGRPAIGFQFRWRGQDVHTVPIVLTNIDRLADTVTQAVVAAYSQDGLDAPAGRPDLEDVPEPVPVVVCDGCGRRLFGDRAEAGTCTGCDDEGDDT